MGCHACESITVVPFMFTLLWECVAQACKVADLGCVNIEDEATKRQERYYVPNWFSVEIKTGVSDVHF